jgi:uncharacterized membrane protein YkvA (DUF1232 family)
MAKKYTKSIFYQKAMSMATEYLKDPEKLKNLIKSTRSKLTDVDESKKVFNGFIEKIRTLVRMVLAYRSGEYREISWKSMLMVVGGLLYFVMPIDIIPDFIPGVGLLDDLSVIMFLFKTISEEIAAFEEYESSKSISID